MNAFLISLPLLVRIGMFCRLGLVELNLPVAVSDWLNVVCTFPVVAFISCGSASVYVEMSFFIPLYSRIFPTIGWRWSISLRVSSSVG